MDESCPEQVKAEIDKILMVFDCSAGRWVESQLHPECYLGLVMERRSATKAGQYYFGLQHVHS